MYDHAPKISQGSAMLPQPRALASRQKLIMCHCAVPMRRCNVTLHPTPSPTACTQQHEEMLALQGIDPAAEGLANGDAAAGVPKTAAAGVPPVDLAQSFRSRGVQGSIAIGNLAELLESEDELTRFTAAKVDGCDTDCHQRRMGKFIGIC